MASETKSDQSKLLRSIPSVTRLLDHPCLIELAQNHLPATVSRAARTVLNDLRSSLLPPDAEIIVPEIDVLAAQVVENVESSSESSLLSAINATGIVLHTGLGRARLHNTAAQAINSISINHSLLEIDAETGERGSRQNHVNTLLCELTGSEAAAIVNNCAGAVLLAVTALAAGKEVVLSRGEMVEIGGAFRMPDIIKACGAKLVEVGTTNRTRIADYRQAITEQTGLILRCHPSNYRVMGFTEAAANDELVALGREHMIPVMEDQGSGAIIDSAALGLCQHHGSLPNSAKAGFDIITASGDKLLGGPQAGILLGGQTCIDTIMHHPLARALRVDKLTLAGLEATLRLYRDPANAIAEIPTLRYLTRTEVEIKRMAQKLRSALRKALPAYRFSVSILGERSQAGGGSLPGDDLPTTCVAIRTLTALDSVERIAAAMRSGSPAVFGRIKDDAYLLDPRTMEEYEIDIVAQVARGLIKM